MAKTKKGKSKEREQQQVIKENCSKCHCSTNVNHLFYNTCGCSFCFDCATNDLICYNCNYPIDCMLIKQFYHNYCYQCKQRTANSFGSRCKQCVYENNSKALLFEKQYLINNMKRHQQNMNEMLCVICLDNKRNCAVLPCAHFSYCNKCVEMLVKANHVQCSVCKQDVRSYQKVMF